MSEGKLGCLLGWLRASDNTKAKADDPPKIMVSNKFITRPEADFYRVLRVVVGDRGIVLAQVSLNQLFFLPGSNKTNPGRTSWHNRIARKSVDFVVADPRNMSPLFAIELDESSHATPSRQTRDDIVDRVFDAAGLPLLRTLVSGRGYNTADLEEAISPYLSA